MAKELPYFKFEPNQWDNGNIQMCTREDKGLFVDICSMYWSRLGDLPSQLVINKLCGGIDLALLRLVDVQVLSISDGFVVIDFLDEQLQSFDGLSQKNRDSANKRWVKHRENQVNNKKNNSDANALPTHTFGNALAIPKVCHKRREEKNIYNGFEEDKYSLFIKTFNEIRGSRFTTKDRKFRKNLDDLLKAGFKANDSILALRSAMKDDYHKSTGFKYLTPEFITRIDKVERFLNVTSIEDSAVNQKKYLFGTNDIYN